MYQMIKKETILKALEAKGPLIPVHLKREVAASDTIILGAILSELVAEGKVKISSTKIGGSPAYYVPGTEARLVNLVKHLNEKDKRTAELLEQKKILKDSEQTPLVRVSLRNIKDYAKPLEVNLKAGKELYWKWFIISAEEAEQLIMKSEKLVKAPELKKEEDVKPLPVSNVAVEEKPVAAKPTEKQPTVPAAVPAREKKQKAAPEEKKETKEQKKPEPTAVEVQKQLPKQVVILGDEKNAFLKQVKEFFEKNEIMLLELKFAKKSEAEMIVSVPSRIGNQEYYCKAKSKKKVSDTDLSAAYIQGQATKLPVLFLITGELNKKAKEMLGKEFKGMLVKAI